MSKAPQCVNWKACIVCGVHVSKDSPSICSVCKFDVAHHLDKARMERCSCKCRKCKACTTVTKGVALARVAKGNCMFCGDAAQNVAGTMCYECDRLVKNGMDFSFAIENIDVDNYDSDEND